MENQKLLIFQLRKGQILLSEQKYDEALQCFQQIIKIDKNNPLVHNHLGLTYYYYEQYEKALEEFEIAISFSDKSALIYKGLTLIALTKNQEALQLFDQYLQNDPNNQEALKAKGEKIEFILGNAFLELGYYDQSQNCFNQILKQDPTCSEAFFYKSQIYIEKKEFLEAIICLDKGITLNPKNEHFILKKIQCYMALKDLNKALECSQQAIKLNSKNCDTYITQGQILYQLEKYTQCTVSFDMAIELNSKSSEANLFMGLALAQLNRFNEAIKYYNAAAVLQPNDPTLYNNMGIAYKNIQDFESALECFAKACQLKPTHPLYQVNKALIQLESNNRQIGIETMKGAKLIYEQNHEHNLNTDNIEYIEEQISKIYNLQQDFSNSDHNDLQSNSQSKEENKLIQSNKQMIYMSNASMMDSQFEFSQKSSQKPVKMNNLLNIIESLNQKVTEMEKKLEIVGINKQFEIKTRLEQFKKDSDGLNQLAYFQSFYWTVLNYFVSYNQLTTKLQLPNYDVTIESFSEQKVNQIQASLSFGSKLTSGLPIVSSIMDSLHSGLKVVFEIYKKNKFQDRVEIISEIIKKKVLLQNDLELQIAQSALELSEKKKKYIINLEKPIQRSMPQGFIQEVQKIIEKMTNEEKSSMYLGGAGRLGLVDAFGCLGYFYCYGLMDDEKSLNQEIVEIVILEKHIQYTKQTQIVNEEGCCNQCQLF